MATKKKNTKPKESLQKLANAADAQKQIVIVKEKRIVGNKRTNQNQEVQQQMSKYTIGMLKENKRGYGIINNGEDNLFPDYLNGLAAKSPTNQNIIDDLADYVYGKGLKTDKPSHQAKLDKLFNTKKVKNIIKSKFKQAAITLELIKGENVDEVVQVYYHNTAQFRVAETVKGTPVRFVYRKSWDKSDSNNYQVKEEFDRWDFDDENQECGIYYWYDEGDMPVPYGRPGYISCLDAIELEISAYKGVNHGVQNGNEPSKIIELTSSGSEAQDKKDIEAITRDTSGVANRGKLSIRMKPQGAESMTVIESGQSDLAEQYNAIFELAEIGILKGWKIVSPSLISGLNTKASGFSSPAEEMQWAKEELFNKIINPERREIIEILEPVIKNCGIEGKIYFEPMTEKKAIEVGEEVEKKKTAQPALPIQLENNIVQTTDSIKFDKKGFLDETEVSVRAADTLEDVLEGDFVVIDARPVSENTEEILIAEIEKQLPTKLASSGMAFGNAESENDGTLKDIQYKIRYRYERASGYPNQSGGNKAQRDFCGLMMNGSQPRNRWFRMEDIERMNESAVNRGFGKGGGPVYDILKYKGGPNCKHIWVRYVFVKRGLEGSIDVKSPVAQNDKLNEGQAASIGIRPKMPESPLMSIPPYAMPNQGYATARMSESDSALQSVQLKALDFYSKAKKMLQNASNKLNSSNLKPTSHG